MPPESNQHAARLQPTIRRLIRRSARRNLSRILGKVRPEDVAVLLEGLTPHEQDFVVDTGLGDYPEAIGEVFVEMSQGLRVEILERLEPKKIGKILDSMPVDDRVAVVESLPGELAEQVLSIQQVRENPELVEQLTYAEDTAGRLMSTEVFSLHEDATVQQAIETIQSIGEEFEMIFYLYVVGEGGQLTGVISLRELLLAKQGRKLEELMNRSVIKVTTDTDQEEVARLASRYDLLAVPVTDIENHLMGVITIDDVITVVNYEMEEDLFKMVGSSNDELIYEGRSLRVARIRLPWLLVNFVGLFLGGLLIERSEGLLVDHLGISTREAFFLLMFVPIIMGMGGNAGSQTSTIAVRGLATGRLVGPQGRARQFLMQQAQVGAMLGSIFALLAGTLAVVLMPVLVPERAHVTYGVVVAVALFSAVFLASLNGAMVPLLFERLGIDPAVASGPMVTTSCDIIGLLVYFMTAAFLIQWMVL